MSIELAPIDDRLRAKEARLLEILSEGGRTLLAYSGGVDSAFLAVLARERLGDAFRAVLADSPSLADWEREEALEFARSQSIPVEVIATRELENPDYTANEPDRCFHCKGELFGRMETLAAEGGFATLIYGGNFSDRGDHRPGADAARRFKVRAPLDEAGLEKPEIRSLAKERGLAIWEKPARACLASRIPHFEPVDEAKLLQLGRAEKILRDLGFAEYRVRHHGLFARIELGAGEWDRMMDTELRIRVDRELRALGFGSVSLDLRPFASGSLSRMSGAPESASRTEPDGVAESKPGGGSSSS